MGVDSEEELIGVEFYWRISVKKFGDAALLYVFQLRTAQVFLTWC
jgi:hypothetical protein